MSGRRAGQVSEKLENDILTGVLTPGQRLEEEELAQRFKVSRTPVREALMQLASIGLVERSPGRGAVVARISARDLLNAFEVTAELEGMAGRLAARRMTPSDHAALERLHEACMQVVEDTPGDSDRYYAANVAFHDQIYAGSRNAFLVDQLCALRARLGPYRRIQLTRPRRISESFAEHGQILDAIRRGDGEEADRLLFKHVNLQGEGFADLLSQLPQDYLTA